jgi:pyridoxamine 5'-phosphate oxidase
MLNPADIRRDYKLQTLSENDIEKHPMRQFDKWWEQAISSQIDEVNAMTLATVGKDGQPSARIVLLKGYDDNGFVFFTNYHSRKGHEMESNNKACLVFFWKELERQIRIEGSIQKISEEESDVYFLSRPTLSKIGAWASPQSEPVPSRAYLENRLKSAENSFVEKEITRPPHWGGYTMRPHCIEFWQGREGRLHDRIVYNIEKDGKWSIARLAP